MRLPGGGSAVAHPFAAPGVSVALVATTSSRLMYCSATAARRSIHLAKSGCSFACTSPRWRSGNERFASRGIAPITGTPSAAIASLTSRRCRSLPTRLSTTPAIRTAGSWIVRPRTSAAAVCDWPETSRTSSTGNRKRAARSAAAPVRPAGPGTPSNKPMAPSISKKSALLAASSISRPSSAGGTYKKKLLPLENAKPYKATGANSSDRLPESRCTPCPPKRSS